MNFYHLHSVYYVKYILHTFKLGLWKVFNLTNLKLYKDLNIINNFEDLLHFHYFIKTLSKNRKKQMDEKEWFFSSGWMGTLKVLVGIVFLFWSRLK